MIYFSDGRTFDPGSYDWEWVNIFTDMMYHASPALREEILNKINGSISVMDSVHHNFGYCDKSHAVDLGDKHKGWGRGYLYVWLDKNGIPFYVGKAEDPLRMSQFAYKTRSEEFQNRIREGGCHAVMVANHIPKSRLDDLEKNLIAYMGWRGFPLVNVKDVPSKEKVILWSVFQTCKNVADVQNRLGVNASEVFLEWKANMTELEPAISSLDEVIGVKWEGECADLTPKKKDPPKTFTYKGETKTWREWGKIVGISGATLRNRIESLGWPIEKAMSTPSMQAKSREKVSA